MAMEFSYMIELSPGAQSHNKHAKMPGLSFFIIYLVDMGKQQNFWARPYFYFNNQVPAGKLVVSVS